MGELLPRTSSHPDDTAVITDAGSVTWHELETNAARVANGLIAAGLGVGDRWALLAGNCLEWPELYLGNVIVGAKYVPLNWHLTVPELVYLLENSEATFMVVDAKNEANGREAARQHGIPDDRIVVIGDGYTAWRDAQSSEMPEVTVTGSALLYTGGTTGRSKGVVRADSGVGLQQWLTGTAAWGSYVHMPASGPILFTTPLYHAYGAGVLQACLSRGHTMVLRDRFDTAAFLADIESFAIAGAPVVPTLMVRLAKLDDAEFARYDLSSLQWICHTAAPCPAWAKQRMIDLLGPIVIEFYGSSEGTGPCVCTSQEWLDRPGTVGRPSPVLTVSVVDDDGNDVPVGSIGTLYFARVDGAPEYHGDRDKTDKSRLPDGRFTVGDVGWIDEDNFIYLADRRVDLILAGGVNVYPAEIEGVISEHPAVRDVAVFGIPHPELGEQVKAAVETEPGKSVTEDEIIAWCRERLAGFKCPRSVDFHDALPREAHGKLKKRLLRDAYWPAQ